MFNPPCQPPSDIHMPPAVCNHRWKALDEINAGICDGLTYEQINERFPFEYEARKLDKLRYRYPSGESYLDVIQRVEPVRGQQGRGAKLAAGFTM